MKKRILCYGDSNTWGYIPGEGARYPKDVRWTGVLADRLGEDYEIIEDGINGRTTIYEPGWGECRNGKEGLKYALLSCYPLNGLVLMLGTNDLSLHDAAFACKGMSELLRIAKNADYYFRVGIPVFNEGSKILLIAPPEIGEGEELDPLYVRGPEESKKFASLFKKLAEDNGVAFLNAADYAQPSGIDHIHLSQESHEALGNAVAEKLKELFEE